jgi:hypothetical protein
MEKKKNTDFGGTTYSDPSMVMVGFSRQTHGGNGVSLFGSSVQNHNVISLKITKAELNRHLSRDWYHGDVEPILEVLLSPTQFAELLTSMNVEFGVPGTLVQHGKERFEIPVFPSRAEQFKDEIRDDLLEVASTMRKAEKEIPDLLDDPKPIGKAIRKKLRDMVKSYYDFIERNIPFVIDQFSKQMNKTVVEAKAEVDAFVQNTVIKTGIAELKKSTPQLTDTREFKEAEHGSGN